VVTLKDGIVAQLETRGGLVGWGESSPMASSFGYSSDTPDGCWEDLCERVVPRLLGTSIEDEDGIAAVAARWADCSRFAVAGAETACWDLLGQKHHECIAELMGVAEDRLDDGIPSGLAVGLYPSVVELLRAVETHLVEGYHRLKIKIAPGQDVELVRAIRQHFGEIDLMVDANAAYTVADLDVFRALDEFDLLMFEQPMAANDIEGLAALQAIVDTPVCLDESADDLGRTEQAIRAGACRIVNLKLQRVGGFGPARASHDLCQRNGVACWVGCMPELGIGQAHGLHLAALPNCRFASDIEPSTRWFVDDYVTPLLEMSGPGRLSVPTRAGLGFQPDPAKLRRYQVRQQEFVANAG
jgi:O-succinylbenzoate synthase